MKSLQEPISRQHIAVLCDKTARLILQIILRREESFVNTNEVFDGWTDHTARSYLGVTIHVFSNAPDDNYDYSVIGHIQLNNIHISHNFLSSIILNFKKLLFQFRIIWLLMKNPIANGQFKIRIQIKKNDVGI